MKTCLLLIMDLRPMKRGISLLHTSSTPNTIHPLTPLPLWEEADSETGTDTEILLTYIIYNKLYYHLTSHEILRLRS